MCVLAVLNKHVICLLYSVLTFSHITHCVCFLSFIASVGTQTTTPQQTVVEEACDVDEMPLPPSLHSEASTLDVCIIWFL